MKKIGIGILALLLVIALTGCRSRTSVAVLPGAMEVPDNSAAGSAASDPQQDPSGEEPEEQPDPAQTSADPETPTEEDPNAERKSYSDEADAELTAGAENRLTVQQGSGAPAPRPDDAAAGGGAQTAPEADHTATETVPADQAEQTGASEDGETAESSLLYYQTLLQDRLDSLFECQRLNVYWEDTEAYTTIHKSSQEHQLILAAGAYDVAAKLAEGDLNVDSGWVQRKNPGAVVKVVPGSVLGGGVQSSAQAQALREELLARSGWSEMEAVQKGRVVLLSEELLYTQAGRTAAEVYLAKALYPALFEDTDADEALRALEEESGGTASGLFFFAG